MFKSCKAAFIAVFLCLITACSAIETVGDYLNENPVFASMAARQAVGRYIAAGDTLEDEKARAANVKERITRVLDFIDGNPETDVDGIMLVVDSVIDWDQLSPADRLLVQDVVLLVEQELRKHQRDKYQLSESASIAIKALFKTAVHTAEIYLRR